METVNFGLAFLGGLLSFLSPCILPLAPGYLGLISGVSAQELAYDPATDGQQQDGSKKGKKGRVLQATGAFILGFTVVFVIMGLTSSFLGQLLAGNRNLIMRISGVIVILLGLHQAGWLPIPWLYRERRFNVNHSIGLGGAFLTGLAFSLGWTPCVGPILGSIMALAASQAKLGEGILLLTVYSAGLAVPFLLLAVAFDQVSRSLNKLKRYMKYLEWASGILLILMGILLLTGGFLKIIPWLMRLTGGWDPESIFRK
jgi:cytochrome c-type biogenesis protein